MNHLKFCSCSACRGGLHSVARNKARTRRIVRSFRQQTKQALRAGRDVPQVRSVPFTD